MFYLFKPGTEQMHGIFGLCDLVGAVGAFHGDKSAADTQIRQAQLTERPQACHGSRHGDIVCCTALFGNFLRARVDAAYPFKLQLFAHLAEKVNALIEAVKQRDIHLRLHDLQNKAGKACAGADIDDLFIRKIAHRQQRCAVEKMQARNIL